MQILHVTPIARSITTEVLSYFSVKPVATGTLVTVPLRKKQVKALVVHSAPVTNMKILLKGSDYQIRNILEIHNEQVFSPEYLQTCNAMKNFYATNTGKLINLVSPSFILKNLENFDRPKNTHTKQNPIISLMQKNTNDRISYYKTLIREKMLHKQSLHIICPTQNDAISLYAELVKNNESSVFLLHSKITKKKTQQVFETIHTTEKSLCLISTPGFIDSYLFNKSLIVIEKENSEFYRTIAKPYIDMREFIIEYTRQLGIECIIAGSVLRPETWKRYLDQTATIIEPINKKIFKSTDIIIHNLNERKPGKQTDQERIKELDNKKKFTCLGRDSINVIKTAIKNKEKIFIFCHKKSLAPSILCRHCGNMARSAESGAPYSLYLKQNQQTKTKERIFVCHNTGEKIPAFDTCQFCNGHHLISFGIGTQRIFEEISELFPDTLIQILDAATSKTQKSLNEIITKHQESKTASIIIGTQKALPYINNTGTSIITSLDSYFARMSHNTLPQTISLTKEISENTKNFLIIQSRNILESSLPILEHGLYSNYIQKELNERKEYIYPPYGTLITIRKTIKKEYTKKTYQGMNNLLDSYNPNILIQPGKKRGFVELICLLQLSTDVWNTNHQDQKLYNILVSFDRMTNIHINPKDLI